MVRGFGLRFCSADLVLTPDGRHIFLDLNPNGQWLWLETEAGLPPAALQPDLLADDVHGRHEMTFPARPRPQAARRAPG